MKRTCCTFGLAQGIPFFHAGDDLLRSKSFDKNSSIPAIGSISSITLPDYAGIYLELHPILRNSITDFIVKQSQHNATTGTFTIRPFHGTR